MPRIDLPLRHVALFSSGVGFFSRAATLSGAGECELLFKSGEINDILKSLVLLDPHGGARHVSYDAQEELQRSLREAGIDLAPATSLADVLRQFQGVEVSLRHVDGRALSGRILSVSTREIERENGSTTEDTLTLFGAGGLMPMPLGDVASLQVLDDLRRRDFEQALAALGAERGGERRGVRLHFNSDKPDEREVRVSYGHEVPLWKTSYRLVLGEDAPFLQGWAIVENTSEEDWSEVELSLVAGRPISFVQDLYTPLHARRPTVRAQISDSPLPQLYEQTLEAAPRPVPPPAAAPSAGYGGPAPAEEMLESFEIRDINESAKRGVLGVGRSRSAVATDAGTTDLTPMRAEAMSQSSPAASGAERGELFEYQIAHAVSIARRSAAMVPIVGGTIDGEKLSIYNPSVYPRPLRGFLLKNTSGVHLAGGPLTVFDDDLYAGDAQVADVTIGDERLLSYAVDLDIVARHEEVNEPSVQIALKAVDGVLRFTTRMRRVTNFEFRNTGQKPRTILIQRPLDLWKIIEPDYEKTPTEARFRVPVEPGANVKTQIVREKKGADTFHLGHANATQILEIATHDLASPALRAALGELAAIKRAEAEAQDPLDRIESELSSIEGEQKRIRANMDKLDHKSPLYNQYVDKLTQQESRIETLRAEQATATEARKKVQERVREFVRGFNFE